MKLLRCIAVVLAIGLVSSTLSLVHAAPTRNTGKGGTAPGPKTAGQTRGSIPDRRSPQPVSPGSPPTIEANLPNFNGITLNPNVIDRIKNSKK